jgi:hypothetical protein
MPDNNEQTVNGTGVATGKVRHENSGWPVIAGSLLSP